MNWHGKRYYSFDSFLKNYFGEKIYKVSLDGGFTVQTEMEHLELVVVSFAVRVVLGILLFRCFVCNRSDHCWN